MRWAAYLSETITPDGYCQMRYTRYVKNADVPKLELEVVPQDLRTYLTRLLESRIPQGDAGDYQIGIIWQNRFINRARNLLGLPLYVLESDDWGFFHPAEHAWHQGEFEIMLRRLSTVQFVEWICDVIQWKFLIMDEINELLEQENLSFRIKERNEKFSVEVFSIEKLEREVEHAEHPNIRLLVNRMDDALQREDYAGVLHSSASIFETMAKDVVGLPTVQNQTLKSFFDRYRKDSGLPDELLNYIISIYDARNTTPLAGHGSTQLPTISKETAIVLCEMTIAFVRIEYTLHAEVHPKPQPAQSGAG